MTLQLVFWILMLLWLLSVLGGHWGPPGPYWDWGGRVLVFLLFLILGWQVFGAPVK